MTTTTRTIKGIVSTRTPNDPAKHSPHVDPARPGDDKHQSEYEQGQYLKAHGAEKNRLMKQFCKLEGPSGNSAAFQRGWDAAFGTPEVKARALAEIEAEKGCVDPDCIEATATTDAAGPRHGDGRLALHHGGLMANPAYRAGYEAGGRPDWSAQFDRVAKDEP